MPTTVNITQSYDERYKYSLENSTPFAQITKAHKDVLGCEPTGHYKARTSPERAQMIQLQLTEFEKWDIKWEVDTGIADSALALDRLAGDESIMLLHLIPWRKPIEHYDEDRSVAFGPSSWSSTLSEWFSVMEPHTYRLAQIRVNRQPARTINPARGNRGGRGVYYVYDEAAYQRQPAPAVFQGPQIPQPETRVELDRNYPDGVVVMEDGGVVRASPRTARTMVDVERYLARARARCEERIIRGEGNE